MPVLNAPPEGSLGFKKFIESARTKLRNMPQFGSMIGPADRLNIERQFVQYGRDGIGKIIGFRNRQLALANQPSAVGKISKTIYVVIQRGSPYQAGGQIG